MTERIPCKTPDSTGTIFPATVERTDDYCMPCLQAIERKVREAFIRENHKNLDELEGLTDRGEILKIIY